jgi:lipopolysaccharide/colanic/teichoic acid biosynthesis glycosyltransferase
MRTLIRLGVPLAQFGWILAARQLHLAIRDQGVDADSLIPYLAFCGLAILGCLLVGAPSTRQERERWVTTALAGAIACLGAGALIGFFAPNSLPRFAIAIASLGMVPIMVGASALWSLVESRQASATRVLAVVSHAEALALRADATEASSCQRPFLLVEVVTEASPIDLADFIDTSRIDMLILSQASLTDDQVVDTAERLHASGLRVRTLDDFYDEFLGKLPLGSLDRASLLVDIESVHGSYAPLKRLMDILGASIGAFVAVLFLPLIVVGNMLANRGPLFFRQERVGRNGTPFSIWKFRTMSPGAVDVSGWTSNEDPRITRFGRLLRRTHLDELPQVINIFAGQLSIVGPRPEQVTYVQQLADKLPYYHTRHLVTPGLTGWAQVNYRYAASEEDAYVKLQYDLHYLRHESLARDLRIIWMTIEHLLFGRGR